MFFTLCMVVFLHPMWYCPSGEIAVPLHPEKRTGHHNRCGLPLFRHTETQVYRCSAYHISWWLSTRWTWLISVKMYTTRLLPTIRRCRRRWISVPRLPWLCGQSKRRHHPSGRQDQSITIGTESTVKSIDFVEEHLEEAYAPMSITYDTLFGIPSIVYGSFAFTLMVWLGISASLGGGILVTTLLIVPILIRSMDEVAKTIPQEILDSSYSLGATRIETIGVVLRQIAAASLPLSVFFQLSAPQEDVQNRAYAAAVVLTIIVLVLSFGGRFIMSHFSKNKI